MNTTKQLMLTGLLLVAATLAGCKSQNAGYEQNAELGDMWRAPASAFITLNAAGVATNVLDIAANAADISTLNVTANGVLIATNALNITTNTADSAANTGNIATNAMNIATWESATNALNIVAHGVLIGTNTLDIAANGVLIGTNTLNVVADGVLIATNTVDIGTNTLNVAANGVLIGTNTLDIAALQPTEEPISALTPGTTITNSIAAGRAFTLELTNDVDSIVFTNLPASGEYWVALTVTQDSTGTHSMATALAAYPANAGSVDDASQVSNTVSRFVFVFQGTNCVLVSKSGGAIL